MVRTMRRLRLAAPTLLLLAAACNCEGEPELGLVRPRIEARPNPLVFGEVYVGEEDARPLVIKNAGNAKLEVSALELEPGTSPGFTVPAAGFALAPSEERTLLVLLVAQSMGPLQGAVLIHSDDPDTAVLRVPITAVGARRPGPAISVCAESQDLGLARTCPEMLRVDFGEVPTGGSVRASLVVKSVGDRQLNLSQGAAAPGSDPAFRFAPAALSETLAVDAERVVEVALEPVAEGPLSAIWEVRSDDPQRAVVQVELVARGVRSALCASPGAVDFGTTAVGQPVMRTVELENCGQLPLELRTLEIEAPNPEMSVDNPLAAPVPLAVGARYTVQLSYSPLDRGRDQGRLRALADRGQALVALVGQTEVCDLQISPPLLSFGAVAINQSRSRSAVLTNSGAAACAITGLPLTGSNEFSLTAPPGLPISLAAGGAMTLEVSYSPVDMGMDSGTLTVESDDPDAPAQQIMLDGRRLELGECQLSAMPDPIAFGVVPLGMSRTQGVVITNDGTRSCTILTVGMSAASDPAFAAAGGPTLPLVLPGRSFTVQVSFSPRQVGTVNGQLEIRAGVTGPPLSFPVSGAGSGPRLCITPDPVIFGTHPMGSLSTQTVTMSSCGSDPLVVSSLLLAPPTSSEYSFMSPPPTPLTLPPGATQLVLLRYQGVDVGRDDGVLRVASNDPLEPSKDLQLIAASGMSCGDVVGKICGLGGTGPVPGATVYVDTPGGRVSSTTNAQGDFVLTCLPPGNQTVHAEAGSWSTTFSAQVNDQQVTVIPGMQCLDPSSARVAVVWGEWDQIQGILQVIGVPFTFYGENNQSDLLSDPAELAQYDIVFLNCGFYDGLVTSQPNLLQDFVAAGGSVYASDWAYDALEVGWPGFVDYYQDDALRDDAQDAGNFNGLVDVVEPTLRAALGGQAQVSIMSCCTGIDGVGPGATIYLQGDRLGDGGTHPFFVGFQPGPTSGTVMYTDFHNNGQPSIEQVFRWLINRL